MVVFDAIHLVSYAFTKGKGSGKLLTTPFEKRFPVIIAHLVLVEVSEGLGHDLDLDRERPSLLPVGDGQSHTPVVPRVLPAL